MEELKKALQMGMMAQQAQDFLGEYEEDIDWDILIVNSLIEEVITEETDFYNFTELRCGEYSLVFRIEKDYGEIREIRLWFNNTEIDNWEV